MDLVWIEAKNHCGTSLMVFTATDPDFVARCFDRYPNCRAFVCQITVPDSHRSCAPGGGGNIARKP